MPYRLIIHITMESHNSTEVRCPYCWNIQNIQKSSIVAFPHPFLKTHDKYIQSIYRFIRPRDTINDDVTCNTCSKKFSITFFTKNPINERSKTIFNICLGQKNLKFGKPLFERFLESYFTFVKKRVFDYEVYTTTIKATYFFAAVGLYLLLSLPYLIMKYLNLHRMIFSTFDFFIFLIIVFSGLMLTYLFTLIEENSSKLSIKKMNLGLHQEYNDSNWAVAFNEAYLKGLSLEYIHIPVINKSISRPMLVGLISPFIYIIYKYAIISSQWNNPNYPLLESISIIPFWLFIFFSICYSFSYSISSTTAIRIIIRNLKPKINFFAKKDSYQELGDLWENSIMIFIVISIIISLIVFGLNSSQKSMFNFANLSEFFIMIFWLLVILIITSWIWLSSFFDLRDKYQITKDECTISLKEKIQRIKNKSQNTPNDSIRVDILLFKLNLLSIKPQWPINRPVLFLVLPLLSPLILVISKIREIFPG